MEGLRQQLIDAGWRQAVLVAPGPFAHPDAFENAFRPLTERFAKAIGSHDQKINFTISRVSIICRLDKMMAPVRFLITRRDQATGGVGALRGKTPCAATNPNPWRWRGKVTKLVPTD
jgi:hypothetical protein